MKGFIIKILNQIILSKMRKQKNIKIAKTAKVNALGIHFKTDNTLFIGEYSIFEGHIYFDKANAKVTIGNNTYIGNSNIVSAEEIIFGNDILVAWGCTFVDHNSHSINFSERKNDVRNWYNNKKVWDNVVRKPIIIKDKAWIGFNSIILKGVTIGEGSVIGAGSVVTESIPDWSIAVGNPAKVIKEIPAEKRV